MQFFWSSFNTTQLALSSEDPNCAHQSYWLLKLQQQVHTPCDGPWYIETKNPCRKPYLAYWPDIPWMSGTRPSAVDILLNLHLNQDYRFPVDNSRRIIFLNENISVVTEFLLVLYTRQWSKVSIDLVFGLILTMRLSNIENDDKQKLFMIYV